MHLLGAYGDQADDNEGISLRWLIFRVQCKERSAALAALKGLNEVARVGHLTISTYAGLPSVQLMATLPQRSGSSSSRSAKKNLTDDAKAKPLEKEISFPLKGHWLAALE